jgi:hypothetical protein
MPKDSAFGNVFVIVTLNGWPPNPLMEAQNSAHENVSVSIKLGTDGRIRVKVTEQTDNEAVTLHEVVSARLVFPPIPLALSIGVKWSPEDAELWVQDAKVGTTSDALFRANEITFSARPNYNKPKDFSARNCKVVQKRTSKLPEWLKAKEGTRSGGSHHLFESLADEIEQMEGMLQLYRQGKRSFARGLAGKLRLLLLRDRQVPLLLACAALKTAPLIVYAGANPGASPGEGLPGVGIALGTIQERPDAVLNNPVDIEVWLGFEAMRINRKSISNHSLIGDLGNTIGNHLDPNIVETVDRLRGYQTTEPEGLTDAFTSYVVEVADVIVALAKGLLEENPRRQP